MTRDKLDIQDAYDRKQLAQNSPFRTTGFMEFWSRLRKTYLILIGIMLVVGSWWLIANVNHIPAYGDSVEYLSLAKTLKVDQYRTIFYPAVLRICGIFRYGEADPFILFTYLVQLLAVLASSALYATALIKTFSLAVLRPKARATVVALTALLVATQPLVAHFSLSIMSDSLASSLTVAAVGALAHLINSINATVARRVTWLMVSAVCLFLMALSRVDKLYLGVALALGAIVNLYMRGRTMALTYRHVRTYLVSTSMLFVVAISAALMINRATQVPSPSRPPIDVSTMAFNRVVWPRLGDVYPYLPNEAKALINIEEAKHFDAHNNNVYPLLDRLLSGHPENTRVLNEITLTTLRKFPLQVFGKTAFDTTKYLLPNLAFPLELASVLPESTATDWTYSRMSQPYPGLTKVWMLLTTSIFYLIQAPIAVLFLRRRCMRDWITKPAVMLTMVGMVCNAGLFGLEAGMDAHIRYALPTFVMWMEIVVVASLLWLFATGATSEAGEKLE